MSKTMGAERITFTSQVQDTANEMGEFTMRDLAYKLVEKEVISINNLSMSRLIKGFRVDIRQALKAPTPGGAPFCVSIGEGAESTWKVWRQCTKRESRRALQIMCKNLSVANKAVQALYEAHLGRFHDPLSIPHLVHPRTWDEDLTEPPSA